MKDIVILYHADCPDGFTGAWAAWKKFGNKAEYIGIKPSDEFPKGLKNKELYFVDVAPRPSNKVPQLIKNNKKLVIIDHHLTNREVVEATGGVFDLKHSGAALAWRYFHPGKKTPRFVEIIEDFDLWKFRLPYTKEMSAYIELMDYDFKSWDKAVKDFSGPQNKKFIENGRIITKYQNHLIKEIIERGAIDVIFEGKKGIAVNCPHKLASQIGDALIKRGAELVIIWNYNKDHIKVSLRPNGKINVSKIAEKFGGGGHKNAAGFILKPNFKFPWTPIK